MRTTLLLDDDVLQAARAMARQENRTMGEVVSELLRKVLHPQAQASPSFPTFAVSPDALPLTPEMVRKALEE